MFSSKRTSLPPRAASSSSARPSTPPPQYIQEMRLELSPDNAPSPLSPESPSTLSRASTLTQFRSTMPALTRSPRPASPRPVRAFEQMEVDDTWAGDNTAPRDVESASPANSRARQRGRCWPHDRYPLTPGEGNEPGIILVLVAFCVCIVCAVMQAYCSIFPWENKSRPSRCIGQNGDAALRRQCAVARSWGIASFVPFGIIFVACNLYAAKRKGRCRFYGFQFAGLVLCAVLGVSFDWENMWETSATGIFAMADFCFVGWMFAYSG